MPTITTDALDALLHIQNGNLTARWNFPSALGSSRFDPAGVGLAVDLTFSFRTTAPGYDITGFAPFTPLQEQMTRLVLANISEYANARFTEISGVGQVTFASSAQTESNGFAWVPNWRYTYDPGTNVILSTSTSDWTGDVWINSQSSPADPAAWSPGTYNYKTLLHEVGHALGLKHPFENVNEGYVLDPALDHRGNTVMSYTYAPQNLVLTVKETAGSYTSSWSYLDPTTLMAMDVKALQFLYGANMSTRTGDDHYRWEKGEEILETLWDAGGKDTIDASNQTLRCEIDLSDGASCSIGLRQTDEERREGFEVPDGFDVHIPSNAYDGVNNLSIAAGAVIENARGGSNHDSIRGNDVANNLSGEAGDDTIVGAAGHDTLSGGLGADSMEGGTGNDRYHVDGAGDVVKEESGAGRDQVMSTADSHVLSEQVEIGRILATGAADLFGNGLRNVVYAGAGNNVMDGGVGRDTLSYLYATAGVTVRLALKGAQDTGGSGTDLVSGFENLVGSRYADELTGDAASNVIEGGSGRDVLVGGAGKDVLSGGSGQDVFSFLRGSDSRGGSAARDVITDFDGSGPIGDRLDLRTLDANLTTPGDDAFTFIGSAAFGANATGQVRYVYDSTTGAGIVYVSTDSDAEAELAIQLNGVAALAADDFLL